MNAATSTILFWDFLFYNIYRINIKICFNKTIIDTQINRVLNNILLNLCEVFVIDKTVNKETEKKSMKVLLRIIKKNKQ